MQKWHLEDLRIGKSFGTSPDRRSKEAISNCDFFTLDHADNLHLEKRWTVLFCALNRKTCPDRFQLAGPLSEKSQKQLLLATQTVSSRLLLLGKSSASGRTLWPKVLSGIRLLTVHDLNCSRVAG